MYCVFYNAKCASKFCKVHDVLCFTIDYGFDRPTLDQNRTLGRYWGYLGTKRHQDPSKDPPGKIQKDGFDGFVWIELMI